MPTLKNCPSCGSAELQIFYRQSSVPVHSVQLISERELALNYPTGEINLGLCRTCGFISNLTFDPAKEDYATQYESTQAYSPTFNSFAAHLANRLIERYDLHHKKIVEIGSGQGEFLSLLCELGENDGVGIDPAYVEGRLQTPVRERLTMIRDYYSEKYAHIQADFYCCKMTLEHIQDTGNFVSTLRRTIDQQRNSIIFFQIPNVTRVLEDTAFWDIYYEHCSYFSPGSLARLFRHSGFDVLDLWKDYGDQYLMIEAKPGDGKGTAILPQEDDLAEITECVDRFMTLAPQKIAEWRETLKGNHAKGKKVVLWGSGSKGVAFLTTLGIREEIEYTVDINPLKAGTYMAGTGQRVVRPDYLREYQPDLVVVMNPIYIQEVQCELEQLGLSSTVLGVT